jgi:hypothetical protein
VLGLKIKQFLPHYLPPPPTPQKRKLLSLEGRRLKTQKYILCIEKENYVEPIPKNIHASGL